MVRLSMEFAHVCLHQGLPAVPSPHCQSMMCKKGQAKTSWIITSPTWWLGKNVLRTWGSRGTSSKARGAQNDQQKQFRLGRKPQSLGWNLHRQMGEAVAGLGACLFEMFLHMRHVSICAVSLTCLSSPLGICGFGFQGSRRVGKTEMLGLRNALRPARHRFPHHPE